MNITVTVDPVIKRDLGTVAPSRAQILHLERELQKLPQLEITTEHRFAEGLYAREITIPKGAILTGMIHHESHLNIISRGDITVWTEDGMQRLKAPCTLVSQPGTKRAGYAHEETVWTTIHANPDNLQDIPALEARLVYNEALPFDDASKLESA